MTVEHTVATAAVILGTTGTVAMIAYRLAAYAADPRVVPAHLAARAHWWNHRVSSLLQASMMLLAVGIVGFVTT
ncbi:MAG TPA: hypothetical protein VHF06_00285 [Pseudonocardiaceae bacterium]|jgi:hypothetical protein|nr:hypothetical protein [Pseudonocardiaceae bacterium]